MFFPTFKISRNSISFHNTDRFTSEEDGQDYWYTGRVIGFDTDTERHTVEYKYEDNGDEEDEDEDITASISEEPLLEDYGRGDVKIFIS